MFAPHMPKSSGFTLPRKKCFRRDESGNAAVEFALVAIPFFACMFAIIEVGLVFFAGQVLETSVGDASRLILTGQAAAWDPANAGANFKSSICTPSIQALFTCDNIKVDVSPATSFTTNMSIPTNPSTGMLDTSSFGYHQTQPCDIVIVRAVYEWPTFVRGLGLDLSSSASTSHAHILLSTAAFRNEPYTGSGFC